MKSSIWDQHDGTTYYDVYLHLTLEKHWDGAIWRQHTTWYKESNTVEIRWGYAPPGDSFDDIEDDEVPPEVLAEAKRLEAKVLTKIFKERIK